MKLAGSFEAAVDVAEQTCKEWIFTGDGDVVHTDELHEIAREYDAKTPLEDDELLAVTEDGSIGLMFPHLKEPQWYFVSPEFADCGPLRKLRSAVAAGKPLLRELRGKEHAAVLRELRRAPARGREILRRLRYKAVKGKPF